MDGGGLNMFKEAYNQNIIFVQQKDRPINGKAHKWRGQGGLTTSIP